MSDASPRLSRWLLGKLVSARLAEEVLADLEERYRQRVLADGRRAANWWYRRQVLGALAPSGRAAGPGVFDALQDFRHGARKLARKPGVAAALILTLALGIGANAAIFSVVNGVLLRPLPYPEPEQLVQLRTELPLQGRSRPVVSGPELLDLRAGATTLASFGGIWFRPGALTDDAAEPEDIGMAFVTAGVLETLGVGPALGRWPSPAEDVRGAEKVIVLADSLWQRRYGADAGIVGKRIEFDGVTHTVIGVMPSTFEVLLPPDTGIPARLLAWVPFGGSYDEYPRDWRVLTVVGRLAPGVSAAAATAQLDELADNLRAEHTDYAGSGLGFRIQPLGDDVVTHVRPLLLLLLGAVGLMLLIVCANCVNLLLAGMTAARQELAVRSALGATRGRLVRQLASESIVVVGLGALGGVLLARWAVGALPLLAPQGLPRGQEIQLDLAVLAYVVAISALTAIAFGTFSGLHVRRQGDVMLRSGGRAAGDSSGSLLRSGLVVFEVAICLMLLIGVGLMTQSFAGLVRQDAGFEPGGVTTVKLSLVDDTYPYSGPDKIARFYQQLEDRLSESAGIDGVGGTTLLPLDGDSVDPAPYAFETVDGPTEWGSRSADQRVVTPGFLDAIGARLLAGRFFSPADNLAAPFVAIVDETLAAAAWPGQSAVGKRLQVERYSWVDSSSPEWAEVVGVVEHVRQNPARLGVEQVFVPHPQVPMRTITMAIRGDIDPDSLLRTVAAATASIDSKQPTQSPVAMETHLAESVSSTRFAMTLLGLFSTVAVILAILGTYGVISYTVTQRTRELGIAMALGASPGNILGGVLGRGARLAAAGIAMGLLGAVALSRFLADLLYGVGATDIRTFIAVATLLAFVALAACYVPARRAARLDPTAALRAE